MNTQLCGFLQRQVWLHRTGHLQVKMGGGQWPPGWDGACSAGTAGADTWLGLVRTAECWGVLQLQPHGPELQEDFLVNSEHSVLARMFSAHWALGRWLRPHKAFQLFLKAGCAASVLTQCSEVSLSYFYYFFFCCCWLQSSSFALLRIAEHGCFYVWFVSSA